MKSNMINGCGGQGITMKYQWQRRNDAAIQSSSSQSEITVSVKERIRALNLEAITASATATAATGNGTPNNIYSTGSNANQFSSNAYATITTTSRSNNGNATNMSNSCNKGKLKSHQRSCSMSDPGAVSFDANVAAMAVHKWRKRRDGNNTLNMNTNASTNKVENKNRNYAQSSMKVKAFNEKILSSEEKEMAERKNQAFFQNNTSSHDIMPAIESSRNGPRNNNISMLESPQRSKLSERIKAFTSSSSSTISTSTSVIATGSGIVTTSTDSVYSIDTGNNSTTTSGIGKNVPQWNKQNTISSSKPHQLHPSFANQQVSQTQFAKKPNKNKQNNNDYSKKLIKETNHNTSITETNDKEQGTTTTTHSHDDDSVSIATPNCMNGTPSRLGAQPQTPFSYNSEMADTGDSSGEGAVASSSIDSQSIKQYEKLDTPDVSVQDDGSSTCASSIPSIQTDDKTVVIHNKCESKVSLLRSKLEGDKNKAALMTSSRKNRPMKVPSVLFAAQKKALHLDTLPTTTTTTKWKHTTRVSNGRSNIDSPSTHKLEELPNENAAVHPESNESSCLGKRSTDLLPQQCRESKQGEGRQDSDSNKLDCDDGEINHAVHNKSPKEKMTSLHPSTNTLSNEMNHKVISDGYKTQSPSSIGPHLRHDTTSKAGKEVNDLQLSDMSCRACNNSSINNANDDTFSKPQQSDAAKVNLNSMKSDTHTSPTWSKESTLQTKQQDASLKLASMQATSGEQMKRVLQPLNDVDHQDIESKKVNKLREDQKPTLINTKDATKKENIQNNQQVDPSSRLNTATTVATAMTNASGGNGGGIKINKSFHSDAMKKIMIKRRRRKESQATKNMSNEDRKIGKTIANMPKGKKEALVTSENPSLSGKLTMDDKQTMKRSIVNSVHVTKKTDEKEVDTPILPPSIVRSTDKTKSCDYRTGVTQNDFSPPIIKQNESDLDQGNKLCTIELENSAEEVGVISPRNVVSDMFPDDEIESRSAVVDDLIRIDLSPIKAADMSMDHYESSSPKRNSTPPGLIETSSELTPTKRNSSSVLTHESLQSQCPTPKTTNRNPSSVKRNAKSEVPFLLDSISAINSEVGSFLSKAFSAPPILDIDFELSAFMSEQSHTRSEVSASYSSQFKSKGSRRKSNLIKDTNIQTKCQEANHDDNLKQSTLSRPTPERMSPEINSTALSSPPCSTTSSASGNGVTPFASRANRILLSRQGRIKKKQEVSSNTDKMLAKSLARMMLKGEHQNSMQKPQESIKNINKTRRTVDNTENTMKSSSTHKNSRCKRQRFHPGQEGKARLSPPHEKKHEMKITPKSLQNGVNSEISKEIGTNCAQLSDESNHEDNFVQERTKESEKRRKKKMVIIDELSGFEDVGAELNNTSYSSSVRISLDVTPYDEEASIEVEYLQKGDSTDTAQKSSDSFFTVSPNVSVNPNGMNSPITVQELNNRYTRQIF